MIPPPTMIAFMGSPSWDRLHRGLLTHSRRVRA
jgi:hypothetical protein